MDQPFIVYCFYLMNSGKPFKLESLDGFVGFYNNPGS